MNLQGSCLSFPFRVDQRGALVTTTDTVAEAIADVLETRVGERVMLPSYGIRDLVFAIQDRTFAARLSYELKQEINDYVPGIAQLYITVETLDDGKAQVLIEYTKTDSFDTPRSLVFPIWRLNQ